MGTVPVVTGRKFVLFEYETFQWDAAQLGGSLERPDGPTQNPANFIDHLAGHANENLQQFVF